jgi:predicted transcriptional regulator
LSSNGSNKKGKMVDWRRNKVQQLLVRGYSQWDVAKELQIDQSTVSRDVQYLTSSPSESSKTIPTKTAGRISMLSYGNESSLKVKLADC